MESSKKSKSMEESSMKDKAEIAQESSSKRAGEEPVQEKAKKQKIDDDQEDIIKEGKIGYFQIIRADGSSKRYSSMIQMLKNFDREDLETLWKLVKAKQSGPTRAK
ncbi:hypothetical protein Tco_1081769 [Tanacetum coccineum]|uniref:Uncharacterized protein n=1 Tax=Tanacetum coccineum TaxID=301880 RepID=A0ABQ5HZS4_9ASTR